MRLLHRAMLGLAALGTFGRAPSVGATLEGGTTFHNPAIDGSLTSVDFFIRSLPVSVAAGGWEAQFELTGPGRLAGAVDSSGALSPYSPGEPPSIVGTPGTTMQLLDFSDDVLVENIALVNVQVRINAGSSGVLSVLPSMQFTTLSSAAGQAIPLTGMSPGQIVVGAFLAGDVDLDGDADLKDFSILKQSQGIGHERRQGDLNGDRRVDLADYNRLRGGFGLSGGAVWNAAPAAVPEPSAAVLAAALASGCLLRLRFTARRRRYS